MKRGVDLAGFAEDVVYDSISIKRTKITQPVTSTVALTLPSTSGQLALSSAIPSITNLVTLNTTQTITGAKKFNSGFTIGNAGTWNLTKFGGDESAEYCSFQYNGAAPATLDFPQTSGTIALVSQIPTNSTYVDLSTVQTISARKAFTGQTGVVTSGTYPRTSASNQQSSTFTTPCIQIGGSTNDGIYSSATDIVDLGTQGTNYISLQPQGIYRFVGGTVDPAIVLNQRLQVMNGANGATSPAIQIDNQNSGFYRVNQGTIGIGISGVATARWSSSGLNLFGVAGTAAAPAIVLANDTTSGLFRPAANQLAVACSGSQVGNWSSSGLAITGAVSTSAGTVGAPAVSMGGDSTSGWYRPTANQVALSIAGSNLLTASAAGLQTTQQVFGSIFGGNTQSISTGTATPLGATFTSQSGSGIGGFTCLPGSGTISFTTPSSVSFYLVTAAVDVPPGAGIVELYVEDQLGIRHIDTIIPNNSVGVRFDSASIVGLSASTAYTLTIKLYHTAVGNLVVGGAVHPTRFAVYKLL